jgi:FkbM family methyltransferase
VEYQNLLKTAKEKNFMYKLNQINGDSIALINNNSVIINLDEELSNHFNANEKNHGLTILKQINDFHFYDYLFSDNKNLTVLDIGANIGLFSLHVYPICNKIIAFEPTPSHYSKLLKLTKNTNIECRELALSDKCGEIEFKIDLHNSTMNSIVNFHNDKVIKVKCINLETILSIENLNIVDFCKIDIEGSEIIAITEETLKPIAGRIKEFFVEVHPTLPLDGMDQQQNKMKLWNIFEKIGYDMEDINFETFMAKWNK